MMLRSPGTREALPPSVPGVSIQNLGSPFKCLLEPGYIAGQFLDAFDKN